MPRHSRLVVPGVPYHVTQRGNRRMPTFFCPEDYVRYLALLARWGVAAGVEILAFCLMPNHVHLVCIPAHKDALALAMGEIHRRYTQAVNKRQGWTGCLWQGRFHSVPLDEPHFYAAVRYVELNPVRAGLVQAAWDWPWSSARAHVLGLKDGIIDPKALTDRWGNWTEVLQQAPGDDEIERLRRHERSGLPLGAEPFVAGLELNSGRMLRPGKRGPRFQRSHQSEQELA